MLTLVFLRIHFITSVRQNICISSMDISFHSSANTITCYLFFSNKQPIFMDEHFPVPRNHSQDPHLPSPTFRTFLLFLYSLII